MQRKFIRILIIKKKIILDTQHEKFTQLSYYIIIII